MSPSTIPVCGILLTTLLGLQSLTQATAQPLRLGILGDSNSDEYRADDNRGGAYAAVTFNWVEVLEQLRDVDVGTWGTRSEPRRSGYEFNWARSGAKAADLGTQQEGLAQQVRQGHVEYVVIHIGTNDFHPSGGYADIYNGTLSGTALQQRLQGILANIRSAARTLLDAGGKVLVTGVPDAGLHPAIHSLFPDASKRQRVTNAVSVINSALRADAASDPNLAYSDMAALFQGLSERVDSQGNLVVGGQKLNMLSPGNDPRHLQLADSGSHLGTIGSSLMANYLIITPLKLEFGTGLAEISDTEMLCLTKISTTGCSIAQAPPAPPRQLMVSP